MVILRLLLLLLLPLLSSLLEHRRELLARPEARLLVGLQGLRERREGLARVVQAHLYIHVCIYMYIYIYIYI